MNMKVLSRGYKTPSGKLMNATGNPHPYPLDSNTLLNFDKLDIPAEMTSLKVRSHSQTFSTSHTGRRNWIKI
jgi:hypothetical protein